MSAIGFLRETCADDDRQNNAVPGWRVCVNHNESNRPWLHGAYERLYDMIVTRVAAGVFCGGDKGSPSTLSVCILIGKVVEYHIKLCIGQANLLIRSCTEAM
jgi:hypothetical protein